MDKMDIFSKRMVNKNGDLQERVIYQRHMADDIFLEASGVIDRRLDLVASGILSEDFILGAPAAGIPNPHYIYSLDKNVIPDVSGTRNVGTVSIPWGAGAFDSLYVPSIINSFSVNGRILLSSGPISDLHAATKKYVDDAIYTSNEFIELVDTPDSYASYSASGVRVKASQDGLEFYSPSMLLTGDVSGYGVGSVVCTVINDSHNHTGSTISGLSISNFLSSDVSQWTNDSGYLTTLSFLGLSDTPNDYTGFNASGVRVNIGGGGLEFYSPYISLGGDISGYGLGSIICSVVDDSHNHTASTISGLNTSSFVSNNISQWSNDSGYMTTVSFLGLSDTPDNYVGFNASGVRVNSAGNSLEFYTPSLALTGDVTGYGLGSVVCSVINDSHDHTGITVSGLGISNFTSPNISQWTNNSGYMTSASFLDLTDTPDSYVGLSSSGVRVNIAANGLEFYAISSGLDEKVKVDSSSTAGYLGSTSNNGVLRTGPNLSHIDGGDYVTIDVDSSKSSSWDSAVSHITSDGSSHTFIGQDVTSGSSPSFINTNMTGNISVWTNDTGYISSESDTLDTVTDRGSSTSNSIMVGGITASGNIIADASGTRDIGSVIKSFGNLYADIVNIKGNPTTYFQAANKGYVDTQVGSIVDSDTLQSVSDRGATTNKSITTAGLNITGGSLSPTASGTINIGTVALAFNEAHIDKIYLKGNPATSFEAATKKYVDDNSGGSPGGSNTYVQYNDGGSFGGESDLTWNKSTNRLTVNGDIIVNETITYDTEYDNGNSGSSKTIDWNNGNKQKITMTNNCTISFTAPPGPSNLILRVIQDATGGRTVSITGSLWPSGTDPTFSTGIGNVDIVSIYYNGSSYYCQVGLNFS